jgi:hypothetical protein
MRLASSEAVPTGRGSKRCGVHQIHLAGSLSNVFVSVATN